MGAFGDDKLDFYAADLGPSISVNLTVASATSPKLIPRRYRVQFIDTGAARVWARVGPFNAVTPVVATLAAPSTPFAGAAPALASAFDLDVRPNHNDQIAAILSAGTGKMIITPLSRVPKIG